jgi:hypothetical protein
MATQTLTTFDAIMKDVYRGTIVELLNQETYLIDMLEKTNANDLGVFTGRRLIFPVHVSRNRGRSALTDGSQLPGAGRQGFLDGIVLIKYFSEAVELTDMVIQQSQSDEGAFTRSMSTEMDGASNDLRKDISRMTYGTGDGVLANISAPATSATQTVDSGQYIAVGDTVDVLTKSTGAVKGTALTVISVTFTGTKDTATQANATIVLSGSVTTTALDSIYVSGDRVNESDGLRNICNTGRVLHSIDSTANPIWDSNVINAANSTAGEDLYMQLAQRIRQRSGKDPDVVLTTLGAQRRLANTYSSQKRWNDAAAVKIDGGYSAIMVSSGNNPMPVLSDVDAPIGCAFELNKGSFAWAELAKPDWLKAPDGNGSVWYLKDGASLGTKSTVWQAFMTWYATLVNVAPLRNGQITNINDDLPVARI